MDLSDTKSSGDATAAQERPHSRVELIISPVPGLIHIAQVDPDAAPAYWVTALPVAITLLCLLAAWLGT